MERIIVQEFVQLISLDVGGDNLPLKQEITASVVHNHQAYTSFTDVHKDWLQRYQAVIK